VPVSWAEAAVRGCSQLRGTAAADGGVRAHLVVVVDDVAQLVGQVGVWAEAGQDLQEAAEQPGAGVDGAEVAVGVVPAAGKPPSVAYCQDGHAQGSGRNPTRHTSQSLAVVGSCGASVVILRRRRPGRRR
jgi:hypothetical protein